MFVRVDIPFNNLNVGVDLQSCRSGNGAYINSFYRSPIDGSKLPAELSLHLSIGDKIYAVDERIVEQSKLSWIHSLLESTEKPYSITFKKSQSVYVNDAFSLVRDPRSKNWIKEYIKANNSQVNSNLVADVFELLLNCELFLNNTFDDKSNTLYSEFYKTVQHFVKQKFDSKFVSRDTPLPTSNKTDEVELYEPNNKINFAVRLLLAHWNQPLAIENSNEYHLKSHRLLNHVYRLLQMILHEQLLNGFQSSVQVYRFHGWIGDSSKFIHISLKDLLSNSISLTCFYLFLCQISRHELLLKWINSGNFESSLTNNLISQLLQNGILELFYSSKAYESFIKYYHTPATVTSKPLQSFESYLSVLKLPKHISIQNISPRPQTMIISDHINQKHLASIISFEIISNNDNNNADMKNFDQGDFKIIEVIDLLEFNGRTSANDIIIELSYDAAKALTTVSNIQHKYSLLHNKNMLKSLCVSNNLHFMTLDGGDDTIIRNYRYKSNDQLETLYGCSLTKYLRFVNCDKNYYNKVLNNVLFDDIISDSSYLSRNKNVIRSKSLPLSRKIVKEICSPIIIDQKKQSYHDVIISPIDITSSMSSSPLQKSKSEKCDEILKDNNSINKNKNGVTRSIHNIADQASSLFGWHLNSPNLTKSNSSNHLLTPMQDESPLIKSVHDAFNSASISLTSSSLTTIQEGVNNNAN
eukprot:gene9465-12752_t